VKRGKKNEKGVKERNNGMEEEEEYMK